MHADRADTGRAERLRPLADQLAKLGPAVAAAALETADPRWNRALLRLERLRQAVTAARESIRVE